MELKLREVAQLFNPLDPSPLTEKDLDRNVEEFIVSWARELPPRKELRLVVRLGTPLPAGYTMDAIQQTSVTISHIVPPFIASSGGTF
jgi:hypothetical protein